jgi:toxin ParE1/3/4
VKVSWAPNAVHELAAIRDYISKDHRETAREFVRALFNSTNEQLSLFSHLGRRVPELNDPNYRELIYKRYRIMYTVSEGEVRILTVRNSHRMLDIQGP